MDSLILVGGFNGFYLRQYDWSEVFFSEIKKIESIMRNGHDVRIGIS
jgi:hypothetical protein